MAEQNVVVVRFTERQAPTAGGVVLKECDASGRIGLESAAVVRHGGGRAAYRGEHRQLRSRRGGRLADRGILVGVLGAAARSSSRLGRRHPVGMAFDIDQVETAEAIRN